MHMLFISRLPSVKDGDWTVQFNQWLSSRGQFTDKLN